MKDNPVSEVIKELTYFSKRIDAVYLRVLKKWDLSKNGYLALKFILENPNGVEPAQLADELTVQRQLVTWIINDFQNRGLIIKKENQTDHRRRLILFTKKGRRFAQEVHDYIQEMDCQTMSTFSNTEMKQMIDFHRRFYDNLLKENQGNEE